MKVFFQGQTYSINDVSNLLLVAPNYDFLTNFIKNWTERQELFSFQSSGSTGNPKTIEIHRDQITASVKGTQKALDLREGDQVLLCLNPNYIASIMMAARALILDLDLHIIPASSTPLNQLKGSVDFASFVPFQIYEMIHNKQLDRLAQIRNVLIGGAPLNQEAQNALAKLPNNIYLTYGMTETVSHIALMKISGSQVSETYQCLPGIEIGLHDNDCLKIKGEVTMQQWLYTTDVVEMKSETEFKWLGRADHVINSGGVKIHPEQLEKSIATLLTNQDYFITGLPDDQLGQSCTLIHTGSISEQKLREIQSMIENQFSKHHIPRQAIQVAEFIKTESGKLNRKKTLELFSR
ncbi:AMP-binding protein [Reichenbachiella ulvae]|uniref:AMP-binding protein n=1 Tax=Reichenbachiella ulvae TaxID=2980104 RepID=A0ABT3CTK1_9BACT|nr:AMP-binding protein [Reichenbachiella ulvae]MCV9386563.1 AMP-binding protein [Reichenbachiella ulvae]